MRQYVCAILEASGQYEVLEVANGFEALRTLPRQEFDLIVTDINMPDVSGIELTRFVRANARHRTTPTDGGQSTVATSGKPPQKA